MEWPGAAPRAHPIPPPDHPAGSASLYPEDYPQKPVRKERGPVCSDTGPKQLSIASTTNLGKLPKLRSVETAKRRGPASSRRHLGLPSGVDRGERCDDNG